MHVGNYHVFIRESYRFPSLPKNIWGHVVLQVDSSVSPASFEAAFKHFDKNGDGKLSVEDRQPGKNTLSPWGAYQASCWVFTMAKA